MSHWTGKLQDISDAQNCCFRFSNSAVQLVASCVSLHNNRLWVLVKMQISNFSHPLEFFRTEKLGIGVLFDKFFSPLAFKLFRCLWFVAHGMDPECWLVADMPFIWTLCQEGNVLYLCWYCSQQSLVAPEHLKCGSCERGTGFLNFISF